MISIFAVSKLSSSPSQAVSTIRLNVFKRLSPERIVYWTTSDSDSLFQGSIKRIPTKSLNKYLVFLEKVYWMHKLKPDILLLTGDPFELIFYFFRPRRTIVVTHMNGAMPPSYLGYPFPFNIYLYIALSFLAKRSDFIITIARHCRDSFARFRDLKTVFVIYNGVDLETFNPMNRNREYLAKIYKIDFSRPTVLYIGSLIERKRPDLVLDLAGKVSQVNFILVGAKSSEYDLTHRINSLQNVCHLPQVEREDLGTLLASTDVFCFPSLYEGFGMVVAEAMASGCPVVASDHYGPAELIDNGVDGILIGVGESERDDFGRAIQKLLDDLTFRSRITTAARKKAEAIFDWEKLAKEWEDVLVAIKSF